MGFFAVRWIRKDRATESLTRKNLLLDVLKKMESQNLTSEQLRAIEAEFEKRDVVRNEEDRLTVESYDYGITQIDDATCQQDMNLAQGRRLTMLDAKLGAVIKELHVYLDPKSQAKLRTAQRAWEKFRTEEAEWVSRVWGNGTMKPFIYAGEKSRIAVERIALLQAELDRERKIYASGITDE